MNNNAFAINIAATDEYKEIGEMMSSVYSTLEGFPSRGEQPAYYALFDNLSTLAANNKTDLITARAPSGELLGSVVYFADLKHYGAGGAATNIPNASALRLLAVRQTAQGNGVGRALTDKCIELARDKEHCQVILHTTEYMKAAWGLYERMGFNRKVDLDFQPGRITCFRVLLGFVVADRPIYRYISDSHSLFRIDSITSSKKATSNMTSPNIKIKVLISACLMTFLLASCSSSNSDPDDSMENTTGTTTGDTDKPFGETTGSTGGNNNTDGSYAIDVQVNANSGPECEETTGQMTVSNNVITGTVENPSDITALDITGTIESDGSISGGFALDGGAQYAIYSGNVLSDGNFEGVWEDQFGCAGPWAAIKGS